MVIASLRDSHVEPLRRSSREALGGGSKPDAPKRLFQVRTENLWECRDLEASKAMAEETREQMYVLYGYGHQRNGVTNQYTKLSSVRTTTHWFPMMPMLTWPPEGTAPCPEQ
eukprot:10655789-Heterocapsa_arctica.AAC.1